MAIEGIDGMTPAQIRDKISQGGKFVYYRYCISVIFMTFRRSSAIYFVPPGKNRQLKGLQWTFLTLIAGWWGIPWGPIYSVQSLVINLKGGNDVTEHIVSQLDIHDLVTPLPV